MNSDMAAKISHLLDTALQDVEDDSIALFEFYEDVQIVAAELRVERWCDRYGVTTKDLPQVANKLIKQPESRQLPTIVTIARAGLEAFLIAANKWENGSV